MNDEGDYTLALDEARRSWDALGDELVALRNRTVQLVGIAGVAASVLSALTAAQPRPARWESGVGLAAFLATVLLSIIILWPRKLFTSIDPDILVGWANTVTPAEGTRQLALILGEKYDLTRPKIGLLTSMFCVALVTTGIEIVALAGALWRR